MAVLPDNSVTTSMIQDRAVTANKLGYATVTQEHIARDAVTGASIQSGAVTTAKIDNEAVTEWKLDPEIKAKVQGMTYSNSETSTGETWIDGSTVYQKSFVTVVKKGCLTFNDKNTGLSAIAGVSDRIDTVTVIDGYCAATQNFSLNSNNTVSLQGYSTVFDCIKSLDSVDWYDAKYFDTSKDILFVGTIKYIKKRQLSVTKTINY